MKKIVYFTLLLTLCFGISSCQDEHGRDQDKKEEEKPFTWNGDWNDPKDPNYKKEGYNPIEGDWELIRDSDIRFVFTKDFQLVRYVLREGKWEKAVYGNRYVINNTGFKFENNFSAKTITTEEYKIVYENGQEFLMLRYIWSTSVGDWSIFRRFSTQ